MIFSCKKQDFQPSAPVAAVMLTSQKQSLGFKLIPFVRELVVRLYAVQTLTQGSTVEDPVHIISVTMSREQITFIFYKPNISSLLEKYFGKRLF